MPNLLNKTYRPDLLTLNQIQDYVNQASRVIFYILNYTKINYFLKLEAILLCWKYHTPQLVGPVELGIINATVSGEHHIGGMSSKILASEIVLNPCF